MAPGNPGDFDFLTGEWRIAPSVLDTDGGVVQFAGGTGTWTARRTSDEVSAV